MIEAFLLLGLLAACAMCWNLARRVRALEAWVAEAGAPPSAPAATDNRERPAGVVLLRAAPPPEPVADSAVPDPPLQPAEPILPAFEPVAEPAPAELPTPGLASLFERFVGGRLLVWTGGAALALAGLFLVRFSIERGLLSPLARILGAAFAGAGLVGAGEWARRRIPDDARIGQALVGAGVLILYGAAYGAHVLYGLIGLPAAFALMAGVAVAALALSLRHGAPAAALGMVGGFLTPLLVGDRAAGALPLLGYLGLLCAAVFAVAARTGRPWLAWTARWLTLGWTAWLLVRTEEALAIGAFLLVFTVVASEALRGRDEPRPTLAPGFALLQLGTAVVLAEFAPAGWALLLLLAGAGFARGARTPGLAALPGRAMATALLLLAGHGLADADWLGEAAAATTLLFAGGAWLRLGRDTAPKRSAWLFCIAAAGPALLLRATEPGLLSRPGWAALFALLAAAPAALAWRLRSEARTAEPYSGPLAVAGGVALLLLAAAAADALPLPWVPAAWVALAGALLAAGRRLGDGGLARLAVMGAAAGLLVAAVQAVPLWNILALSTVEPPALRSGLPPLGRALLLFALPAALLAAMWRALPVGEAGLARPVAAAAGLWALIAAYVAYKHAWDVRTPADFAARGFAERMLLTQALFAGGWALGRRGEGWARNAGAALTAVAAARFAWFDLAILNPAFVRQSVGSVPLFNLLLPAFGGTAWWGWQARLRYDGVAQTAAFALFVAALLAGAVLGVRQLFQGSVLAGGDVGRAEFYGYSLAGLLLAVALLLWGWRRRDRALRVAGLALLAGAVVKVFAVDAAALEGILRILSFAGLGVALIGMGKLYGTLLGANSLVRHPRESGDLDEVATNTSREAPSGSPLSGHPSK